VASVVASQPGALWMATYYATKAYVLSFSARPRTHDGEPDRGHVHRLTLSYLAAYLLIGGFGFVVAPALALRLLLSSGAYDDVMPRLVGVFMVALGGVIFQFVRARDYRYYLYTIVARSFIVVVMTALYFKARDPLFLVLDAIVLIGLLPSIYVAAQSARARKRA
jgi:uncharacterized protein YjeT (DUF2065 family)